MKSILFITPFTPDNQGVGVSYTSQLLRELAKNCIIDLLYFRYELDGPYKPDSDNIHIIREEVIGKSDKIKFFFSNLPIFPLFSSRLDKRVRLFLQRRVEQVNYDFIYFDFSQTFGYAKYINHPNKILMAHDVIAQKYSRMKTYLKRWAVHSELNMLKNGTVIFTFSEKDCELIKKLYNVNAKFTTFFLNSNVINAYPEKDSNYFVFFGAWSRIENSEALGWFIDNVYEQLPKEIGFKVIGGGRMPDALIEKIKRLPNVEYLGFVDNPYPIIANAKAEIAPLHMGAGVKVKCVEALGCGTPIIGTEVAFEGIGYIYREAMIEANTPEEYIKAITTINYSTAKKFEFKEFFLKNYNNKQILGYIND